MAAPQAQLHRPALMDLQQQLMLGLAQHMGLAQGVPQQLVCLV